MRFSLYSVFLFVLLLFGFNGRTQTSVTASLTLPMVRPRTIIREYISPISISYVESSKGNFFLYADTTLLATYVPVDSSLIINGFVISNDTVFFCGKTLSGLGIVGFFDVNDYFFGSTDYFVIGSVLYSQNGKVANLSKIVSYVKNGFRHIVTIGTTVQNHYCILDFRKGGLTGMWSYKTGEVPVTSPETMIELTSTDNFIVTSGMYNNDIYNPSLAFRVYKVDDVFSTAYPLQDVVNVFSDASLQHCFCLEQIVTQAVSCDKIVAAAFWKPYTDTSQVFFDHNPQGTYIGKYKIKYDLKDMLSHEYSVLCQHDYYFGKWKLFGFSDCFIPKKSYSLLQEYELSPSGGCQSVIYDLSDIILQSSSPINYASSDIYRFLGISGNSGAPCYLMNGYSLLDNSKMVFNMGPQGGNFCLENEMILPNPIQLKRVAYQTPLLVVQYNNVNFDIYKSYSNTETIIVNCER